MPQKVDEDSQQYFYILGEIEFQQTKVVMLEGLFGVMFFLAIDVLGYLFLLRLANGKCSIAILPIKVFQQLVFCFHPL